MPDQSPRFEVVSFLSDYGRVDEAVGVVSAVIHDLAPHASIVDLTHDIAPFDVRAGSLALARAIAYVPSGIVLAIVDPHSAARRRPIAVEVADGAGVLVGPDNGLLAPAVALAGGANRAVHLDRGDAHLHDGPTSFRGRDIYAPVVAALLNGADLHDVGTEVDPAELLPGTIPLPRTEGDSLVAEVLWIDRFGNVQLNVGPDELPEHWGDRMQVRFTAQTVDDTVRIAYRAVALGELGPDVPGGAVAMIDDAYGMLALAIAERSAAVELAVASGDRVVLAPIDDGDRSVDATATPISVELGRSARGRSAPS